MRTAEIRQRWLDYFQKQDHHLADSIPLISPDKSILFTIAGMVPFIPYIVGTEQAPWPRVASVQKCIRTNDIEEVGKTTRHGTFFQMCGNFSFGDYFKEGASTMAWDLLTGSLKEGKYGLDGDKLWVTIWEEDQEAKDIWLNQIGIDPKHLQFLPREEIFWDTGQPGPAGPCAEIHFDRGPKYGPEGGPEVDTGGDRYLELWNLVFDQYLRGEGSGKNYPLLGELDKKCIDTGLGLERLAFLLQGKDNMYETDQMFPVIKKAEELSGKRYHQGVTSKDPDDIRMRVVCDHVRSALMLINDGVRPGNDGRGYVLRRLIRRVVRSMRLLGVDQAVLPELLPVSYQQMSQSYSDLKKNWEVISQVAYGEEEAFRRTLDAGTAIFDQAVKRAQQAGKTEAASLEYSSEPKSTAGQSNSDSGDLRGAADLNQAAGAQIMISGEDAFTLHDTYGFPIDLTLEMAAEKGVAIDREGFTRLMEQQKQRAREDARAKKTGHVDARVYHELSNQVGGDVPFLGYTSNTANAKIVGLLQNGDSVPVLSAGSEGEIVLDQTPFYAEMGGQLADHGQIQSFDGASFEVNDVQLPIQGLRVHRGKVISGDLAVGDSVVAAIDTARRQAIARAHTATHLLHGALRENLGQQATQAGSENNEDRLRFDFRHGQAVSPNQMEEIAGRLNEQLRANWPVTTTVMSLEEAQASGATALFGEKYGQEVRVVDIGEGWDRELCGGTHVDQTGSLGEVVLLGESSIGSGVRRIEALVAGKAYHFNSQEHALVSYLSNLVGVPADQLPQRVDQVLSRLKAAQKRLAKLEQSALLAKGVEVAASAQEINGVTLARFNAGETTADLVRQFAQDVRQRLGERPAVVAVAGVSNSRPLIVVATTAAGRDRGLHAGNLVRLAAGVMGGGGGGKPDLAQGGGKDPQSVPAALDAIKSAVEKA